MIFVYVFEHGKPPALCLPVDPAAKWAEFKEMIRGMLKVNPDETEMTYFEEPFQGEDDKTLTELGIAHKGLIKIRGNSNS